MLVIYYYGYCLILRETLHLLPPGRPADAVDYRLPDQQVTEGAG